MKPIVSFNYLRQILGFERSALERLASKAGRYYEPFDIRKKTGVGEWRHIDNPQGPIKEIQKRIHDKILKTFSFPDTMFGGVPARSTLQNARIHLKSPLVVTLDLQKCFMSINHETIKNVFRDVYSCSPKIASLLRQLTTFQNGLPQGAPTSSLLANAALLKIYDAICGYCDKNQLLFSIFVDDIVISGESARDAIEPIVKIIQKHGHIVKRNKIKIMPAKGLQKVNGICVNFKPSIPRNMKEEFKDLVFELHGKGFITTGEHNKIKGKLNYFKTINPNQAFILQKLCEKYLPSELVSDSTFDLTSRSEKRRCRDKSKHTYLGLG